MASNATWWAEGRLVRFVDGGLGTVIAKFVKLNWFGPTVDLHRGDNSALVNLEWVERGWRKFDVGFESSLVLKRGKFEVLVDGNWKRVV